MDVLQNIDDGGRKTAEVSSFVSAVVCRKEACLNMMSLREEVPTTEQESDVVDAATATNGNAAMAEHAVESEGEPQHHEDHHDHDNNYTNNDLSMMQAVTLLTADCLGVGILALPNDVNELGWFAGLGFLVLNLPINYYAGKILAETATHVEGHDESEHANNDASTAAGAGMRKASGDFEMVATSDTTTATAVDGTTNVRRRSNESSRRDGILRERNNSLPPTTNAEDANVGDLKDVPIDGTLAATTASIATDVDHHHHHHHDNEHVGFEQAREIATHDFIGIARAVFADVRWTRAVMAIYFVNIFLVLGDYILVMSYAVAAMLGDNICLPWAGVLASILMFAVCQLRTMAMLGREASIISLACLFVVLVQCLIASAEHEPLAKTARTSVVGGSVLFRKFSALASIGFAMGSQKLFLNIRHEMRHKEVGCIVHVVCS